MSSFHNATEHKNNSTEHKHNGADAARENVRVLAETTQDALRSGMTSASENARRFTGQVTEAYGFSGEKRKEFTHQTSQNLEVISEAGALLTRGFQDISRAWFNLMQERLQKNLEGFNALARCRSVPDFMAVQSSLIRDNLEQTIQSTRQIADVSTRVANEANQTITALTKKARLAA
jgi:hypothetical protein